MMTSMILTSCQTYSVHRSAMFCNHIALCLATLAARGGGGGLGTTLGVS